MVEKTTFHRNLQKKVQCYHNSCPLRSTYGSGPNPIPVKEANKCRRRYEKGCAGNE
tara:strand:+ start:1227 stop:1394 length:168 start_codon:yes stop_codon:yes gene_type:complete